MNVADYICPSTKPIAMEFPDPKIIKYAEEHTTEESSVLQALNAFTQSEVPMPNMLSGHLQGRLLAFLSRLVGPKYILEIGTYTGYSAICLAEGLKKGGKLHTIDVNEDMKDIATDYFNKAGVADKIELHIGDAQEIIPKLKPTFDLVFIDADKANYPLYFDLVIDRLKKGGLILADNVLWSGKVLDKQKDKRTTALDAYNKKVLADDRVTSILLPIRDGLNIAQKIV